MILVQPEYLPSVNFFKNFIDGTIYFDLESEFLPNSNLHSTNIVNEKHSFDLKVPLLNHKKNCKIKDVLIDQNKNWVNSHLQSIQSSYGKYPYYIYYIDQLSEIFKIRHNFLVDLNCDLLTLIFRFLDFNISLERLESKNQRNQPVLINFSYNKKDNIEIVEKKRDNFFLGKKFDYSYSIIDLIFLKGPESGFLIKNFIKNKL